MERPAGVFYARAEYTTDTDSKTSFIWSPYACYFCCCCELRSCPANKKTYAIVRKRVKMWCTLSTTLKIMLSARAALNLTC